MDIFGPEIIFLEELEEDVYITLLTARATAHLYNENINYIKEKQECLGEKYWEILNCIYSDTGESKILPTLFVLQGLLYGNPSPETLTRMCDEVLREYL